MKVGIVKYNAGNWQSVLFALERLGCSAQLCSTPEELGRVDKIIFPGVGHAQAAMHSLKQTGLDRALAETRKPLLGVCLGMQLMCLQSAEGPTDCLVIFPQQVKRLDFAPKVPHTGWNQLTRLRGPLFSRIKEEARAYFVHSYFLELNEFASAQVNYGQPFCAAIERDNFFGVQFHPEKSAAVGESILKNFLAL